MTRDSLLPKPLPPDIYDAPTTQVQRRSQWARFGAAADHDDPGITAVSPDDVVIEDPFSESAGQTDTEKLIDKLRQGVAGKSRRN